MLWVVTQDKNSLINVREITVEGKKIEGIAHATFMDQWSKVLGKYESKERALEILNKVFTKLEGNSSATVTFVMPRE